MKLIGWLIVVAVMISGCKNTIGESDHVTKQTQVEGDGIVGKYGFDLYDESGQVTNHGDFTILPNGDTLYTGSWQIKDGPSGEVFCTMENDLVYIHLNIPGLLPQEYTLMGTPDGKTIKGHWRFNVEVFSFEPQGTFEAYLLDK